MDVWMEAYRRGLYMRAHLSARKEPMSPHSEVAKKEFIGPGLHLRPVRADRAWPPLQGTLSSVLSTCGNAKGRIRPPSGQGNLEEEKIDTNHPCLQTVSIEM